MVAEHLASNREASRTFYLHKDALGSIDLITGADASVVDRRSYDAWGQLRNMPWSAVADINATSYLTQLPITNKGYTGHEHVQEVDLIHMNGRVYDAKLARFISADPHIQAGGLSQNYNRYSYVMNNPMKYTDPSGYFFKKLAKKIKRAWKNTWNAIRPYAGIIVGAAISVWCTMCGSGIGKALLAGTASGAAGAAAMGGDVLQGALNGGLQGLLFGKIGLSSMGNAARVFAHATAGGTISLLQGGKFGRGFMSAGFAKFSTLNMKANNLFGMADTSQSFGKVMYRTTVAAIVGGTASEIGGGKFANGARAAAVAHLFNQEWQNARSNGLFGVPSDGNYPYGKSAEQTLTTNMDERFVQFVQAQEQVWWAKARALGLCGEACAAELYRELGYEVYEDHISVMTRHGLRYPDLAIRMGSDSPWSFVEVKANSSPLIRSQVMHDRYIESYGYRGITGPSEILGFQAPTSVSLVRVLVP